MQALAAHHHAGALSDGISDMAFDFFNGSRVDHRANLRIGRTGRANLERAYARDQFVDESVMYALLDKYPVGANAGLAAVTELGHHQAIDGRIDVRIIEDDERRAAAQLQR